MWSGTSSHPPYVHIGCACGGQNALEDLYFCFNCNKSLCRHCTAEEIDSFYCRHCLENMPSTEAKAFKNRCSRCYACPVCFTTLQTLSNTRRGAKIYHLCCQHCYWDSANYGIVGTSLDTLVVAMQNKVIKDIPLHEPFSKIVEGYKNVLREIRRSSIVRPTRESLKRLMSQESCSFQDLPGFVVEAKPQESPMSLDEALSLDFDKVTTMSQRLGSLDTQPRNVEDLKAQALSLLTKRSKRCRYCKKFVVKPESVPTSSTPFRMENLLVYFFPRIHIRSFTEDAVVLVFTNPTSAVARFKIASPDCSVSDSTIAIDAYDYSVEMPTDEAEVEPNPSVLSRDKNSVVLELRTSSTDLNLDIHWEFARGVEMREVDFGVRVRLR